MFMREPQTKLAEVTRDVQMQDVVRQARMKDIEAKSRQKDYADTRCHAERCNLNVGDTVLVREDAKQGKLSYPFKQETFTVSDMKGNMITTGNDNKQITRNSSRLKKVRFQEACCDKEEELDIAWHTVPAAEESLVVPDTTTHTHSASPPKEIREWSKPVTRPERTRKAPGHLKDYVPNYHGFSCVLSRLCDILTRRKCRKKLFYLFSLDDC
jgi:hypothetical protein